MKTMKSLATLTLCIISAFGTSVVLNTQQAKAQQPYCSNATLKGLYAFQSSGFINSGSTPLNAVFLNRFDGNGNGTGSNGTTSVGGNITENITSTATYQVNDNCSVSFTFKNTDGTVVTGNGIVIDKGREVFFIQTNSGTNVSGTFKKVNNSLDR